MESSINIRSIETMINSLVQDIANNDRLDGTQLIKAKLSFQLTKINLGLKLISKVLFLYEVQEEIEKNLFDKDRIKDLSVRELIVMNSLVSKRFDNYYGKLDGIISRLNLRELEGSLNIIATTKLKSEFDDNKDSGNDNELKFLALKSISEIGKIQSHMKNIVVDDFVSLIPDDIDNSIEESLVRRPTRDLEDHYLDNSDEFD